MLGTLSRILKSINSGTLILLREVPNSNMIRSLTETIAHIVFGWGWSLVPFKWNFNGTVGIHQRILKQPNILGAKRMRPAFRMVKMMIHSSHQGRSSISLGRPPGSTIGTSRMVDITFGSVILTVVPPLIWVPKQKRLSPNEYGGVLALFAALILTKTNFTAALTKPLIQNE